MTNTISVRNVSKYFGDFMAVNDLSLEVAPGSTFGLLGPNGAGKTTTIRMIVNITVPDLGIVFAARIPADEEPEGIWEIAPDLAIEVISPNDIYAKVAQKVDDYLEAGVQQVWLVLPEQKSITIYRSPFDVTVFQDEMELVAEDLLPGFRYRLSEIFKTKKPS